jgi:hypothetical protein
MGDDIKEVAEDLAKKVKEILQPAPPPRRATKIGITVALLMLLAFIARIAWEICQSSESGEDTSS